MAAAGGGGAAAAVPNLNINGVAGIAGIRAFVGQKSFDRSGETVLVSLHRQDVLDADDVNESEIIFEAEFTAQSSNQGHYDVMVRVKANSGRLCSSSCSCPMGNNCKHVCRLLLTSMQQAIAVNPVYIQRDVKRRRLTALVLQRQVVYIALTCKSEIDRGSDYNHSKYVKEIFDQEILGVFFNPKQANDCAKAHVSSLGVDVEEEDEDDEDEEEADADVDLYSWANDENYEEDWFHKVWVEERAIEDASPVPQ